MMTTTVVVVIVLVTHPRRQQHTRHGVYRVQMQTVRECGTNETTTIQIQPVTIKRTRPTKVSSYVCNDGWSGGGRRL